MFDDMFDTAEELLSGNKEGQVQSFWQRLPRNCADGLPLPEMPRKKGYPIGLKNSGMTCYLNSLLQILFHTPELRRIILQLPLQNETVQNATSFVSQAKHNFLLGFQQLFSEMSLCDQNAISHQFLRKSFGWQKAEHMQQQDIQQAMRIIFDTMQRALFGTGHDQLIRSLFKGSTIRYKSCMQCGQINEHTEEFFDLQLQVRDVFSVDEAIVRLTTAESMTEDNKIYCQVCQSKQDMWLGTRFSELPGTLVLTLNRFDFDYEKMDRIKITSSFQFWLQQNFSSYLMPHTDPDYFKYELYGVIIHEGSAQGGHYKCYLRDILQESDWNTGWAQTLKKKASQSHSKQQNGQTKEKAKQTSSKQQLKKHKLKQPQNKKLLQNWFELNDSIATAISANEITTKFEGSSSAYILFYRRKSLSVEVTGITVPSYFAKIIEQKNEINRNERQAYNFQKQHIVIKINGTDHKLKVHTTVQTFIETFIPEASALVLQSVHNGFPFYPMQIVNHSSQIYAADLTLQSLEVFHESRWKTYQLGTPQYQEIKGLIGKQRLPFELVLLDEDTPKRIICYQDQNFLILRIRLEKLIGVSYEKQILILVTPYKQTILTDKLQNDDMLLVKLGISHGSQLIIKSMDGEEEEKNQEQVKQSTTLCFLIQRDDVIGLKRIYFEKTKTLRELLSYLCACQSLSEVKSRFRNLNGNRLYYQEHYQKQLSELDLNDEIIKLRVQRGQIPVKGDVNVKFKLQSQLYSNQQSGKQIEVLEKIFDPNAVLLDVKKWACEFYSLDPNEHKLYMTDWLGQPVRSLTREKFTLFELNFGREETVCIRDINSPIGAELIHLQIFRTLTGSADSVQKQSAHLNIEEFKTVGELKELLIATIADLKDISRDRLRLREIKRDFMFGNIWRDEGKSIKSVTINSNKVVLQVLQNSEALTEEQIVLVIKRREKETRTYRHDCELIFDAGKFPNVQDLIFAVQKRVDQKEDIKIAKYVHYNFEWMELSRLNIENVAKGKKAGQKVQSKNKNVKNKKEQGKQVKQSKQGKQQKQKPKGQKIQKGNAKEKVKAEKVEGNDKAQNKDKKEKKEKKGKNESASKTLQDCQNLKKAPVLLKDGDWIGWGRAKQLEDDDMQTAEDLSLRLLKNSKPANYKGKEGEGFKLNVQF